MKTVSLFFAFVSFCPDRSGGGGRRWTALSGVQGAIADVDVIVMRRGRPGGLLVGQLLGCRVTPEKDATIHEHGELLQSVANDVEIAFGAEDAGAIGP